MRVIEITVTPFAACMAAARALLEDVQAIDEEELAWYHDALLRGLPLDGSRSPYDNLLSYNVVKVRPLPCTPDMQ